MAQTDLAAQLAADLPADASINSEPVAPTPSPSPESAPTPSPAPTPTPTPAPVPGVPDAGQPAVPQPGGQQAPPAPVQPQSYRELAAAQGIAQAMQYPDDHAFFNAAIQSLQAARQREAQYQQQLQAAQYQNFAAQQRPPQAPAQPQAPPDPMAAFRLPEWRHGDEQGLDFDPATGQIRGVKPGYPPDLAHRYVAHTTAKTELANRFLTDPVAFLTPIIQQTAAQLSQQQIQQALQARETEQYVNQYVAQNDGWIFERDPATGQPITDFTTGAKRFTQYGAIFHQGLREANDAGIRDQRMAVKYADNALRAFMAAPWFQQQQAALQGQRQQQAIAAQNQNHVPPPAAGVRPNPAPTGAFVPNPQSPQPIAQNNSLSLEQQLTQALNGVSVG